MKKLATIRKCKEKDKEPGKPWCLYSKDQSKLLGRHKTKESAEKQMAAVEIAKHSSLPSRLIRQAVRLMSIG